MKKFFPWILTGVAGIVVMAMMVWLVRSEGKRMREEVRNAASESVTDATEKTVEKASGEAGGLLDKVVGHAGDLLGEARRVPGEIIGGAKDEETESSTESSSKRSMKPVDLVGDLFKLGQDASKIVDEAAQEILGLSVEEERNIGKEVHETFREQQSLDRSPVAIGRLTRLADPLEQLCSREGIDYTFLVVKDDSVNAFSHVGGYVYMNQGLLDWASNDVELQFVLGHEIAHVELKHCVNNVTYATRASQVAGGLGAGIAQMAYQSIALGYSEEQEFDADAWSYKSLRKLGRSHAEAITFLSRLLEYNQERDPIGNDASTEPVTVSSASIEALQQHFRSHPSTKQRIARLEELNLQIKTSRPSRTKSLPTTDSLTSKPD